MDNFWSSFRSVERGLGTRNRWTYFNMPDPMDAREEQHVLHILAGITTYRIQGANGTEGTEGWFFPNTVIPAVAGVKYVSQVFADSGDQSTVEEEDGEELKTWACDLDWEQPDPFTGDSGASVFGSDDGYCSTQCEVVLFKAKTPSQGRRAIQQFAGDDLHENRFSNIMMACTFASTYYCAALFADVKASKDAD
ncbi:uncharacterized protein ACA1_174030 [Acanthamoeba castellanii str. Neff]|uniref:Uncharacterized protein n=1 Tax=Acanthamoeba castellanii (strain ATCC 30010 / Neff) TaxID=1257118 RepID=L8HHT2_ACACF|nr:uncharacterized protein ACA1_174030 [Acanthamoeba castellanii str. Neff]ELR24745.1 hypothetical protein ACA1_174030 [Acanthamoeba castellanii str. Neff]